MTWFMVLVTNVFPGKDGAFCIPLHVKTKNGILLRPIQRFYPLEKGNVPCERIKILQDSFRRGRECVEKLMEPFIIYSFHRLKNLYSILMSLHLTYSYIIMNPIKLS